MENFRISIFNFVDDNNTVPLVSCHIHFHLYFCMSCGCAWCHVGHRNYLSCVISLNTRNAHTIAQFSFFNGFSRVFQEHFHVHSTYVRNFFFFFLSFLILSHLWIKLIWFFPKLRQNWFWISFDLSVIVILFPTIFFCLERCLNFVKMCGVAIS